MPTIAFLGYPKVQFWNPNTQNFLSGGYLYSFAVGSTNPINTYADITDATNKTNPNTNPVVLDTTGSATVVINGGLKLILTDGNTSVVNGNIIGNQIWAVDNINTGSSNISDANGNPILLFNPASTAVNQITISNAATGSPPVISATGSDTNVGLNLVTQGNATINLNTGSSGTTAIQGNATVAGNEVVTGNSTVTGNETITGTLGVTGATTLGTAAVTQLNISTTNGGGINILPSGMFGWFGFSSAPAGWLSCDGSAISRTTYSALFAAIGTTFGTGDGSTTFNLPLQSRRGLVGAGGTGTSTLGNTVGSTGGQETVTITVANLPANTASSTPTASVASVSVNAGSSYLVPYTAAASGWAGGSGAAMNNYSPSLVALLCIKI